MLVVTKNSNNIYSYYTIDGMDPKHFIAQFEGNVPSDIVAAIYEGSPVYEKIINAPRFEPIIEDGEMVDVIELESEDFSEEIVISQSLQNLTNTDYKVIKNMEVIMLALQKEHDIELPYKPDELHETRQGWRNNIEHAESVLNERNQGNEFTNDISDTEL